MFLAAFSAFQPKCPVSLFQSLIHMVISVNEATSIYKISLRSVSSELQDLRGPVHCPLSGNDVMSNFLR